MTFILLKTMDNRDFLTNTSNILTIETGNYSDIKLEVQKGAVTTSPWSARLQTSFSIVVERGTEKAKALELAAEISAAEKDGIVLDLRDRMFSAP